MRLTGADTFNDTGCWQAAAFNNVRSFRAVSVNGSSPLVVLCPAEDTSVHEQQTSLYSFFSDTSSKGAAASPTGGSSLGLSAVDDLGITSTGRVLNRK